MDIRTKEAIRYLGYGKRAVDEKTMLLIQECFDELEKIAEAKSVYRIFEVDFLGENLLQIASMNIQSKSLNVNLQECEQVILFAATLGITVDRRLRMYEISDITKAVVMQACAAAFLEEYCDKVQEELTWCVKPRFSPGYGDLAITYQEEILNILDASKRIGLAMTDGYMLTPTKSITAFIGIRRQKE